MNPTQFLEFAISASLQAAIVVAAAAVARRSGRLSAHAECRLWHWTHGIILGLTFVAATFPHLRFLAPATLDAARAVAVAHSRDVAGQVLLVVWLAGIALSTLSLVAGWISATRCLNQCRELPAELLAAFPDAARQKVDGYDVRLCTGPHVAGPCCWQLHRPYILLPESVLGFNARELQFILQHELEHLQQGHPLQLFVQRVVEIVFWFHPAVWWSARQAALSREFACDEAVAGSRSEIADYLRTLLAVVEHSRDIAEPCRQTLGFGAGASVVAHRSRRLVQLAQSLTTANTDSLAGRLWRPAALLVCGIVATTAWLPINSLASSRSLWSPWPAWSASLAADVGLPARDYEVYDPRTELFELRENLDDDSPAAVR